MKRHTRDACGGPVAARRMVEWLAGDSAREALLGDFEEEFRERAVVRGHAAAAGWYWVELARCAPSLAAERIVGLKGRRFAMGDRSFLSGRGPALIGLIGMIPALFLFSAVVTQFGLGNEPLASKLVRVAHPLPLMLGLVTAIVITAVSLVHVRVAPAERGFVATMQVRVHMLHLAVCVAACVALVMILGYLVTENFILVPRHGPM